MCPMEAVPFTRVTDEMTSGADSSPVVSGDRVTDPERYWRAWDDTDGPE